VALGDKLGVQDAKMRKRALDVFLAEYRPEGAGFDDKGELQGFDKAMEAFKKAEPFFFNAAEPGHGGSRQGADPTPGVKPGNGKPSTEDEQVLEWSRKLYPQRHDKGDKA